MVNDDCKLDYLTEVYDVDSGLINFENINAGLARLTIKSKFFFPEGFISSSSTGEGNKNYIFQKGIKTKKKKFYGRFVIFVLGNQVFENFLSSHYVRLPKADILANNQNQIKNEFSGPEKKDLNVEGFEKCMNAN